jgi:Protein of unknown function (DUF3775)
MDELSLNPRFLQNLILRTRALVAQEGQVSDDDGNLSDDPGPAAPRFDREDLTRAEIAAEIADLEPDQQAELVALMWIGRGDMEPEEWDEAVAVALERHGDAGAAYLLAHPHLAEHWDEGLDRLFDGTNLVETGEY